MIYRQGPGLQGRQDTAGRREESSRTVRGFILTTPELTVERQCVFCDELTTKHPFCLEREEQTWVSAVILIKVFLHSSQTESRSRFTGTFFCWRGKTNRCNTSFLDILRVCFVYLLDSNSQQRELVKLHTNTILHRPLLSLS